MFYKYFFVLFILFSYVNAGIIGKAVGAVKDKAIDKTKDTAVEVYKARKEIRRENEKITGNKSVISKTEDKVDSVKNTAKETAKNSIGKENIEYLQKGKKQMKDSLIGKSIN